jgi:hypothetical protein
MAALLLVSERCEYCLKTIEFIQTNPILIPLVTVHDISRNGIPKELSDVKRVPTLITNKGQRHTGIEVLRWLETNVPCTFDGNYGYCDLALYDEPFDGVGDGFPLDAYGMSLSPIVTDKLKSKIDRPISEAYEELKNSNKI